MAFRFEHYDNVHDDNMEFAQALQQGIATIQLFEAAQNFVEDIEFYAGVVELEGMHRPTSLVVEK